MGLFYRQLAQVEGFLDEKRRAGLLREFPAAFPETWPSERTLVLEEDTALELGKPSLGSLSFLRWSEPSPSAEDRVLLVGPDVPEMDEKSVPFAQVLLVGGSFENEYERYRDIKDAVYETRLKGLMIRAAPSSRAVWCRVDHCAREKGFSLRHLGAALVENLKELDFVSGVRALFITSGKQDIEKVADAGFEAGRIVGAMTKMNEEMDFDCRTCEFQEICGTVTELKKLRKELIREKAR